MKNPFKYLFLIITVLFIIGCQNHTHEFTKQEIKPSCTTEGYNLYVCSCGENYKDNILQKTEHKYSNGTCKECNNINLNYSSLGLDFEISSDNTYYIVSGIGDCEDTIVVIPDSYNNKPVKEIKKAAFKNNKYIEGIYIPDSINIVNSDILTNCSNIKYVSIPKIYNGYIGYLFGSKSHSYHLSTIPISLKEVIIRNETIIEESAFSNCQSIEKIILSKETSEIKNNAFYNCENLKLIVLPKTLKKTYTNTFYNCNNLSSVYYNGEIKDWLEIEFESIFATPMYYANDFYLLKNTTNYFDHLINKESYEQNYQLLDILSIPNNISYINDYQFYGFKKVEQVVIPSSVTSIGYCAFINLQSNKQFIVENDNTKYTSFNNNLYSKDLKELIAYAIKNNEKTFNLPKQTENVHPYAFYNCDNLEEIILNSQIKIIEKMTFGDCDNLKKVDIGTNVELIQEEAFLKCQSLLDISLPETLTTICRSAFEYCVNLEYIFIPKSVLVIKEYAFRNCGKLSIYCEINTAPEGWVKSYWNVYPGCPVFWNQTRK